MDIAIISTNEMIIRLVTAMFLGGVLGIERLLAGKMTGMRTYALVSMGSASFIVIAQVMLVEYQYLSSSDPLRIMGHIITGIGFIGAGLIIFRNAAVRGLTTAAGLWVVSAIGIASGFGLYDVAVVTTLLTLFVFTILWFVKVKLLTYLRRKFPHMDDPDDEI